MDPDDIPMPPMDSRVAAEPYGDQDLGEKRGSVMTLKEITPRHLRCGIGQCPAVYAHGGQDLIIVGKIVGDDILTKIAGKIGSDEYAVRISRAMLVDLPAF